MKSINPGKDRQEAQTIKQLAKQNSLPDSLTIKQIGELLYDSHEDQKNLFSNLIEACKEGQLKYKGSIDERHRSVRFDVLEALGPEKFVELFENDYYDVFEPPEALIHRDDIKAYFQSIKLWPVEDCLLAGWWQHESQTELVGDNTSGSEFEKRRVALRQWMSENGFKEGCKLPKHFTIEKVYCELCTFDGDLFCSFELSTFKRHFWAKQKLCKLTPGRKDGVN